MAATGWKTGSSISLNDGWVNPENALVRDGVSATAKTSALFGNTEVAQLFIDGFDLSDIDPAAEILGVELIWRKQGAGFSSQATDYAVILYTNTIISDDRLKPEIWSTIMHDSYYGGERDTWGMEDDTGGIVTGADLSGFFVLVAVNAPDQNIQTDVVEVRFHYAEAGEKYLGGDVTSTTSVVGLPFEYATTGFTGEIIAPSSSMTGDMTGGTDIETECIFSDSISPGEQVADGDDVWVTPENAGSNTSNYAQVTIAAGSGDVSNTLISYHYFPIPTEDITISDFRLGPEYKAQAGLPYMSDVGVSVFFRDGDVDTLMYTLDTTDVDTRILPTTKGWTSMYLASEKIDNDVDWNIIENMPEAGTAPLFVIPAGQEYYLSYYFNIRENGGGTNAKARIYQMDLAVVSRSVVQVDETIYGDISSAATLTGDLSGASTPLSDLVRVQRYRSDVISVGTVLHGGVFAAYDPNKTFVRLLSTGRVSGGSSSSSTSVRVDDVSVSVELSGNTGVTFTSPTGGIGNQMVSTEIIEYVGEDGGANEFKVIEAGLHDCVGLSTTFNVSGITDPNKVVVWITSLNSDADTPILSSMQVTGRMSGDSTVMLERANELGTVTVGYAVVEYTGSKYTVLHAREVTSSTSVSSNQLYSDYALTSPSSIPSWDNAFIVSSLGGTDVDDGILEMGFTSTKGSDTSHVQHGFQSGHGAGSIVNSHVVYHADYMVDWIKPIDPGGADDDFNWTIPTVMDLEQTSPMLTLYSSGAGNAHLRGARNYELTDDSTLRIYGHRTGNVLGMEGHIIQYPKDIAIPPFLTLGGVVNASSVIDDLLLKYTLTYEGTSNTLSSTDAYISKVGKVAGDIISNTNTNGLVIRERSFTVDDIEAQSTYDGYLSLDSSFNTSPMDGQSLLIGNFTKGGDLDAVINAISTLGASMNLRVSNNGTIEGLSSSDGKVGITIKQDGTIEGLSTGDGFITRDIHVGETSILGDSNVGGHASSVFGLRGVSPFGVSTVGGVFTKGGELGAMINAVSTLDASMNLVLTNDGFVGCVSNIVPPLVGIGIKHNGDISLSSTVDGIISRNIHTGDGIITNEASVDAFINKDYTLLGDLPQGVSVVGGKLTKLFEFDANPIASSSLNGNVLLNIAFGGQSDGLVIIDASMRRGLTLSDGTATGSSVIDPTMALNIAQNGLVNGESFIDGSHSSILLGFDCDVNALSIIGDGFIKLQRSAKGGILATSNVTSMVGLLRTLNAIVDESSITEARVNINIGNSGSISGSSLLDDAKVGLVGSMSGAINGESTLEALVSMFIGALEGDVFAESGLSLEILVLRDVRAFIVTMKSNSWIDNDGVVQLIEESQTVEFTYRGLTTLTMPSIEQTEVVVGLVEQTIITMPTINTTEVGLKNN